MTTNRVFYYFIVLLNLVVIFLFNRFARSSFGIKMRSIQQSPIAASMIGVNVVQQRLIGFVISGAMGALGGGFYAAYLQFAAPEMMTTNESILMLAATIIGGVNSIVGSALGAIILKILPELLRGFKDYYYIVYALVMLVFILYLPKGLAGSVKNWVTIAQQKEHAEKHAGMEEGKDADKH
jgi:branched-chain amino acid transport system permease protein